MIDSHQGERLIKKEIFERPRVVFNRDAMQKKQIRRLSLDPLEPSSAVMSEVVQCERQPNPASDN